MLKSVGTAAVRHRRWFLGVWLLAFVGLAVLSSSLGGTTENNFTIPGTESQDAQDLLTEDFPQFADASASVVFQATSGDLTSADNTKAIGDAVTALGKIDGVSSATNPLDAPQDAFLLSSDKKIAYANVTFDKPVGGVSNNAIDELEAAAQPAVKAGLNVQYSGPLVDLQDPVPPGISEYADEIGLLLAALVLVISFGSVVAMGLPLGTAVGALLVSMSALGVMEHFFTIGSINPIFGTMIGLGVGVDYSLLVLNRYLQNRAAGHDVETAAGIAINTAGRAVIFAGLTITMAVVALVVLGVPYLSVMGFTSAMFIVIAVLAALTLLPALIGFAGNHVESIRLKFIPKRSEVDPNDPTAFWSRWATFAIKRRFLLVPIGLIALIAVAVPLKSSDLGFVDESTYPTSTTERQAYDLIAEGFGPGRNGPLVVAIPLPGTSSSDQSADTDAANKLDAAIAATPGVQTALPAIDNSKKTAAVIEVIPKTAPSSPETQDLVRTLREKTIPEAIKGTSLENQDVALGGETAVLIDLSDRISSRLFVFIGVVLLGAYLLLMMLFRSLLVPLKAVLLNLLMFGAAYGLSVAVFQWGWMRDLIGLSETVPLESFVPVVMFAVLFGLSTDYEVFLVSRIREAYDSSKDANDAVLVGTRTTARVITSAALIMAAVFLSFVTNPSVMVKMIGLPLGIGILLDAFVVRLTIVPGLMKLMGDKAWYLPGWLGKILPQVRLDEQTAAEAS